MAVDGLFLANFLRFGSPTIVDLYMVRCLLRSVSLTQQHVKGMSVKLKWGLESDRLIGNGPLLASFLQLCKWKSKLEMSSPLVPKLFRHCRLEELGIRGQRQQHSAAKLCTLATEQQIYGLGWSVNAALLSINLISTPKFL